jgi:hypothetical protein
MHIPGFVDRNDIAVAIRDMRAGLGIGAASVGFASGSLFFTCLFM